MYLHTKLATGEVVCVGVVYPHEGAWRSQAYPGPEPVAHATEEEAMISLASACKESWSEEGVETVPGSWVWLEADATE